MPVYEPQGDYEGGILVVNEGPFQNGSGTVTYVSSDLSQSVDGIYKTENGTDLGNIFQSMFLYGTQAFLVVNNSHVIEVVNRFTFVKEGIIDENLDNPRYAVVVNGKLYVTNWGDTASESDDFIAVYDVNTLAYVTSISVDLGPEKMQVIGNKIYVAHEGAYGFNNKISVVSSVTNEVDTVIEVGDVPNSIGVDSAQNLWVLCGGVPAWTGAETFGSLHRINSISDEVEKTFIFDASHPDYLTVDSANVLYAVGANVYGMPNAATELPTEVLIETGADFLYSLRASNGFLFATDAKDFSSKGSLTIYKYLSKEILSTVSTGISPNGVYFNN
ncbi:MAG: hypothetical protein COB60_04705 [Flavobacteriaceae bacterium]|nr:MAG: hypothetical protein COB60_04705 [Flavobacteriaceae bacterium]